MAIIGFWSGSKKESGQTVSISAIATHMAVEHNYKILLIDATFDDDTMERGFWKIEKKKDFAKQVNKGKMDIASGAEGLVSAVASNKATPEVITNFTRVVFRNRLDVVCGLKTKVYADFRKSLMLYKDLVKAADKYYDLVFIDLPKTLDDEVTKTLLETSHIIVYNFTKNLKQADEYLENMEKYPEILVKEKIIPLLSNSDEDTVYNVKNYTRYIGEKREICTVPYNTSFVKNISEAGIAQFFLTTRLSTKLNDKNSEFVKCVEKMSKRIEEKLKELKLKT
ncbi:MAG: hypothetical protein IKL55_03765 [Clostridia bacterium]|nr:hypothetical protein [Clostridia bacterium]